MTIAPRVSIVIPLYNKAGQIAQTLNSVQAQTFCDYEVIIVDDGSQDDSVEVVRRHALRSVLIEQENQGPSQARNRGLEAAQGELIAFLDADDVWHPDKLAKQVAVLDTPPWLGWCGSNCHFVYDAERGPRQSLSPIPKGPVDYERFDDWFEACMGPAGCLTSGLMVRRDVLEQAGGFDTDIPSGQDLDLWIRVATRVPQYGYFHQPLFEYRADVPGGITHSRNRRAASLMTLWSKHIQACVVTSHRSYRRFVRQGVSDFVRFCIRYGHGEFARRTIRALPADLREPGDVWWLVLSYLPGAGLRAVADGRLWLLRRIRSRPAVRHPSSGVTAAENRV